MRQDEQLDVTGSQRGAAVRAALEAVLEHPNDDDARLVYADAAEDSGDLERAQFIRLQLQQAVLPDWASNRFELAHQIRLLEAQNRRRWLAELPQLNGVAYGRFRRGFVDTVFTRQAADLEAGLPQLFANTPLRRWVCRVGDVDGLALKTRSPIREVEIERWSSHQPDDLSGLAVFLRSPVATELDRLELPWTRPPDPVGFARMLADWGCHVESLRLGCDDLTREAFEVLLEASGLSTLERLHVGSGVSPQRRASIDEDIVVALLDRCRNLIELDLDVGDLHAAPTQQVFDRGPASLQRLAVTRLEGVDPSSASFSLLVLYLRGVAPSLEADCFRDLRRLTISAYCPALRLPPGLRELYVTHGPAVCAEPPEHLEHLNLVRAPGLLSVVEASADSLQILSLYDCGDLSGLPPLPSLTVVDVNGCNSLDRLIERSPRLRSVTVTSTNVDAWLDTLADLALVDVSLPTIPEVWPEKWSPMTLGGSGEHSKLAECLPESLPFLLELDVSWTADDGDALLEWALTQPNLVELWLRGLPCSLALVEGYPKQRLHRGGVWSAPFTMSFRDSCGGGELSEAIPSTLLWP